MATTSILSMQPDLVKDLTRPDFAVKTASIGWQPDYNKFVERSKRLESARSETKLPEGWPSRLESSLVWDGNEINGEDDYVYHLTSGELEELTASIRHFKALQLGLEHVNQETFPLPNMKHQLSKLREEVFVGKGFFILRGLDPAQFSAEDNAILFLGISSYIAERRGQQTKSGKMIGHIIDADWVNGPKGMRQPLYANTAQPFHSDVVCEVLAMYTRSLPTEGGNSVIASSWKIYNELARTRPDLIHVLSSPDWVYDTCGQNQPYRKQALMHCEDGKVILNFSRRSLTGSPTSPRPAHIPGITEIQAEALDMVQHLAEKHQLVTTMQPGDMRFINNFGILHARDRFKDGIGSKRHLLRLWLRTERGGWKLPLPLHNAMDSIFNSSDTSMQKWEADPVLTTDQVTTAVDTCS